MQFNINQRTVSNMKLKLKRKKTKYTFLENAPRFASYLEAAFYLIVKPYEERTIEENTFIKMHINQNSYFQKFIQKYGDVNYEYICRFLSGKYFQKGEIVFNQGDIGEEFYIIIMGSVSVNILSSNLQQIEVNVLHAGQSFGELALFKGKNGRRAASIICKEKCCLAYFTKDIFNKLIKDKEQQQFEEGLELLLNINLFKNCDEALVRQVFLFSKIQLISMNQHVYKEGDSSTNFYIIKSGQFLKTCQFKNQQIKISTINLGETFGFEELLEENIKGRTYTIQSISSNGELFVIQNQDFRKRILVNEMLKEKLFNQFQQSEKIREERIKEVLNFQKLIGTQTQFRKTSKVLLSSQTSFSRNDTNLESPRTERMQLPQLSPEKILDLRKQIMIRDQRQFYSLRDKLQQYKSVSDIQNNTRSKIDRLTIYQQFFNYEMRYHTQKIKEKKNKNILI